MNRKTSLSLGLALALVSLPLLFSPAAPDDEKKPAPGGARPGTPAREEPALSPLEKQFVEALSGATLAGKWRLVKDGKLGEEQEDRYDIRSVAKVGGDLWSISARIRYGKKDLTVPVPVRVFWAGDTPVISITNAGLPGMGTYTARVMVYQGFYTGTWFAPDHGGFLSGKIEKTGEKKDV